MGRKSSSGSTATVMGLRMIQCGRQTAHVIRPDGQVHQFVIPVKVSDLILLHPHHFVAHASSPTSTSSSTSASSFKRCYLSILPLDAQLETGIIYVILPLPRLFPQDPPPAPRLCACFLSSSCYSYDASSAGTGIGSAIKAELKRHWPSRGTTTSAAATSFLQFSSKISPEEDGGGISGSSSTQLLRRAWEPELQVISEDRALIISESQGPDGEGGSSKGKKLVSSLLARNFGSSNGGDRG